MHVSIAKKLAKKMKQSAGFTLLEILVVLTIMGFLIAMVAPRLAGISGGAVDTVCDSNQQRMVSMMSAYFERTGGFPEKMTNLVCQDGDTDYLMPAVDDEDPDSGPGVFAKEFVERNKFAIHILNQQEADELRGLGVKWVFNLNDYTNNEGGDEDADIAAATQRSFMNRVEVEQGLGVLMSGGGAPAATGGIVISDDTEGWGEPDWIGRIVLGFGPENGLITSGLVANAAHCPGGIQNAEHITYNDYNLVLPRLKATANRGTTTDGVLGAALTTGASFYAMAYTDDSAVSGQAYAYDNDDNTLKKRAFTWEGQAAYAYATQCPEGHMFPADDEDYWAIGGADDFTFTKE